VYVEDVKLLIDVDYGWKHGDIFSLMFLTHKLSDTIKY